MYMEYYFMHFNDITYVFYSTGKKQLVLYTRTIYSYYILVLYTRTIYSYYILCIHSYGPLDPQMDLSLPNDGTTLT